MLPVLTVHHDGSASVSYQHHTIQVGSLYGGHYLLRELGQRACWTQEYDQQYLYSSLVVVENDGNWFSVTSFRTRRPFHWWPVRLKRRLIEWWLLPAALTEAEDRAAKRRHIQHQRDILLHRRN